MPNLSLKNLPVGLHRRLKENARLNRRSLNSEIIVTLENALEPKPRDPEEVLAEIDELRGRLRLPHLTDEFLRRAKKEGRP